MWIPMDNLIVLIDDAGEEALIGGMSRVRVENQHNRHACSPIHPSRREHFHYRRISYGSQGTMYHRIIGGADFDVYKFFDKYKPRKNEKKYK